MAKLRTNHARQGKKGSSGMIVKVGIFGALLSALLFLFNRFSGNSSPETTSGDDYSAEEYFLPTSTTGEVVNHRFYALSYNEKYEQAEWVAYILKKENLEKPWNDRSDIFLPDPDVKTGSATPDDYKGSGYDRGHLAPAADMAYDPEAMKASFLLSNISPQSRNFNKGIWRELEELTRSWAKKCGSLYVVTGPVLTFDPKGTIGGNKVAVPAAFYKVLLDLEKPEQKGIAFILPNEVSFEPLYEYATSIDEVEKLTGIDFFPDLMPADLEASLEANFNLDLWEFSKQKFQDRTEKWNTQQ